MYGHELNCPQDQHNESLVELPQLKAEQENLSKQDDKEIAGFESHMTDNGVRSQDELESKQSTSHKEDKDVAKPV